MTFYLKQGNMFRVTSKKSMDLHDLLPAANYTIGTDAQGNMYLESIDSFDVGSSFYGDLLKNSKRILNTFTHRKNSTGVLLNGQKGSGKTLLAKHVAHEAAKQGIPTIVINAPWRGDTFNKFVQAIEQPAIIFFDEFEKVYDRQHQTEILTLLDGVFPSKKLFILTCNDKWRVDEHMRNRPGRIFYMLDFHGLEPEFIRQYCEDNLDNKSYIEKIIRISSIFDQFNFDMLKALVEEMNRYNESPQEALKMLNSKPEFSGASNYSMELFDDKGNMIPKSDLNTIELQISPFASDLDLDINYKKYDGKPNANSSEDWEWDTVNFQSDDLQTVNNNGQSIVFVNNHGFKVVLTKVYNYQQRDYYSRI